VSDIHDLIREKLPGQRFGIFYGTGEGTFFPDGSEDSSGFVVAEDGSHWFYWTDWIEGRAAFGTWESELFQDEWNECSEYSDALRAAQQQRPADPEDGE
jgi:hypothetical protein